MKINKDVFLKSLLVFFEDFYFLVALSPKKPAIATQSHLIAASRLNWAKRELSLVASSLLNLSVGFEVAPSLIIGWLS